MAGKFFISYRRDDSAGYAHLLYDRLDAHFPNRVFMDISTIALGADFVEAIEHAVGSCDVLIALIGKRWLSSTDQGGRRRLDDPKDFVRLEIASALKRGTHVIPVLLQDATMPAPEDLPSDLQPISRRQALEVTDSDIDHDIERLIRVLEQSLGESERRERQPAGGLFSPPKLYWLIASGVVLVSAVILVSFSNLFSNRAIDRPGEPAANAMQQSAHGSANNSTPVAAAQQPLAHTGTPTDSAAGQAAPELQFNPIGKWVVTTQGTMPGKMFLTLRANHTFEISESSGMLALLGSEGKWTFNPDRKLLVLHPEGSPVGVDMQFTKEQNNSFYASDADGLVFVFTRR